MIYEFKLPTPILLQAKFKLISVYPYKIGHEADLDNRHFNLKDFKLCMVISVTVSFNL